MTADSSAFTSAEAVNTEAIAAWDGPLYDRFVRFRDIVTRGLAIHGEVALERFPPRPGERVLDIGCGFGDTTQRVAGLVGPDGEAVGVDAASRFIETAIAEARDAGVENASFAVADVQLDDLDGPYDIAFSRFGTMFFASPVAALRNVHQALKPGGRLVMTVWRQREDNPWLYRAQTDITLERCDRPITIGRDVSEAVDLVTALGPAGEILRLQGDRAAHLYGKVNDALRAGLREFETTGGLSARASTWIVSARVPAPRT
jgi:SAM-dependent methyltransferase